MAYSRLSPLVVMLFVATSKCAVPGSQSCSSSSPCRDPEDYCDTYEGSCKPCSLICSQGQQFTDCHKNCANYLHSAIFNKTVDQTEIHRLTVMVAITAAMTGIVLALLCVLFILKVRKGRRKLKGILPASVYNVSQSSVNLASRPSNGSLGGSRGRVQRPSGSLSRGVVLSTGASMMTMSTQLSSESQAAGRQQPNSQGSSPPSYNRAQGAYREPGRQQQQGGPRYDRTGRRLPSEDCVVDNSEERGRCNLAMTPSPVNEYHNATHSQVV